MSDLDTSESDTPSTVREKLLGGSFFSVGELSQN